MAYFKLSVVFVCSTTQITIDSENAEAIVRGFTQANVDEAVERIKELTEVYVAKVKVTPDNRIGWVIGKGGVTINELKAQTDTQIHIDRESSVISISGDTIDQVELAISKIKTTITTFQAKFPIPSSKHGNLIGRGGSTIKSIRQETGTRINLDNNTSVVTIDGSSELAIRSAIARVSTEIGVSLSSVSIAEIGALTIISKNYTP